jgi:hypothetical protein
MGLSSLCSIPFNSIFFCLLWKPHARHNDWLPTLAALKLCAEAKQGPTPEMSWLWHLSIDPCLFSPHRGPRFSLCSVLGTPPSP